MVDATNKRLIAHFSHHKAGTGWFYKVLRTTAEELGMIFQQCSQRSLRNDTEIWFDWNPYIDFTKLKNYVGAHMIRDPRDIIMSAYFYHLWTKERWCRMPRKTLKGKSYQEAINSLNKNEGILFEINGKSKEVIKLMSKWNYNNPNILEIKYEDYFLNQEKFKELFRWYGFNKNQTKIALRIVDECSFKNLSKRKPGTEKKKTHLRKGTPGDWKNHFTKKHKEEFKKLFGDVLIKLGYEKDNNW